MISVVWTVYLCAGVCVHLWRSLHLCLSLCLHNMSLSAVAAAATSASMSAFVCMFGGWFVCSTVRYLLVVRFLVFSCLLVCSGLFV